MKTASYYFKYKLKSVLSSKIFIFDVLLMILSTAFSYITRTKLFSPVGTSSLTAYFSYVPYVSIILIPAFCLKQKNPYDSFVPLKEISKVFINFSAYLISFSVMMILLLWMPVFVSFYGDVDWGAVAVSFLALIFFGAASVSLCFFMAEIFHKAVTSFALSALVLAALNSCHMIPQYFSIPKFISNFIYGLSWTGRFDAATKGIFSSADFLYFIVLTFSFLFLSVIVIEIKKGRIFSKIYKRRFCYGILIVVLLLINNMHIKFSADFSKDKIYSVSAYTKKILQETDETVTVHYYKSGKLETLYPSVKTVADFLRRFEKYGKNLKLVVTDCDKNEDARNRLVSYGIYPQRLRTENSTTTEFIDVYSSIVIESRGNIEVLPFVLSPASLEYQIDVKLLKLVFGYEAKVNVIYSNDMTLDDDLRLFKDWFINQDVFINDISFSVEEGLSKTDGPLFVFGSKGFSESQVIAIDSYVKDGKGNVLFMTNPYSVDLKGEWTVGENDSPSLFDLLYDYGIKFKSSMVMDYSCHNISMMSDDSNRDYAEEIKYPLWLDILPQTNTSQGISMFWAVPLDVNEYVSPYILTSSHSYEEKLDFENPYSYLETNPFKVKLQNVQTNSLQNQVVAAYSAYNCTDNVYTKCGIYVISDQYFASFYTNGFIGGGKGDFRNFMFLMNLYWKMNGNEELSKLQGKSVQDRSLYKKAL